MSDKLSDNSDSEDRLSLKESLSAKLVSFMIERMPKLKRVVENNLIDDNECFTNSRMFYNLRKFNDCLVRDVMIPRTEIYAIDITDVPDSKNLIDKVVSGQYTRIPAYENNLDNIIGFIHIKDIISNFHNDFNVRNIIREVMYIPPSMKAVNLFIKMQSSHIHVAVVVDEYGGTEGLVTMADLIEEIVGDIDDEHDVPTVPSIVNISDNKIEVNARVLVKNLEEIFNIDFRDCKEDDYVTIGGLILSMIGRVPMTNEVFKHKSGAVFSIKEADDRCIYKIVIDLSDVKKVDLKIDY
ncbi:transporter associated domain protein [Ehrlichia chaffeensis str. Heartland]|uniref:Hemolysin n=1 Tax=Ehrlichia chaffeensis (strain ATCC CRL-10679 / Arkansas) TaxID=205920 RepID=Q2GI69_EHRCR|nr:hemolysin family protein [Ehrlichia chaffeensis]ABD45248.1 hemolysin [Ehrlichia chaffeensis str. Arkansas]AHX04150.1 transporter associated domain protein [Ehrlichia chaffeensis str. Heartland]AHX06085.1 transporter associated domain protein [Ehrlichia chaffeensis str. Jax]AHX07074.1 transporter associated domain protein [Ehrlichia chaffeensis str. Liberty]AHX07614.1 transporter associated domain protein [Ehrlichia chaffeensis str. Osceola]